MLRIPWDLATSFLWAGMWSFILPPRWAQVPLVAMALLIAYGCYRMLRARPLRMTDAFALLAFVLFIAGLALSLGDPDQLARDLAFAWYLHAIAPILAPLFGYGIASALNSGRCWMRAFSAALFLYPLAFLPAATAPTVLYYSGCAPLMEAALHCAIEHAGLRRGLSAHDRKSRRPRIPSHRARASAVGWLLLAIGTLAALEASAPRPVFRDAGGLKIGGQRQEARRFRSTISTITTSGLTSCTSLAVERPGDALSRARDAPRQSAARERDELRRERVALDQQAALALGCAAPARWRPRLELREIGLLLARLTYLSG